MQFRWRQLNNLKCYCVSVSMTNNNLYYLLLNVAFYWREFTAKLTFGLWNIECIFSSIIPLHIHSSENRIRVLMTTNRLICHGGINLWPFHTNIQAGYPHSKCQELSLKILCSQWRDWCEVKVTSDLRPQLHDSNEFIGGTESVHFHAAPPKHWSQNTT